jgi:RNA 2',3'-cyclic 3'-phosphodiesterase
LRLFVAFELPERLRDETGRRMAEARKTLPPARWLRPEGLHLTLKFVGATDQAALAALSAALAPAFAAAAPELTARLGAPGCFPPDRPARVAWLGVEITRSGGEDARAELAALHRRIEAAAERSLGLTPEGRPFSPHLTVARPEPPWPRPAVDAFAEAFGPPLTGSMNEPFPLGAGALVESVLGPGGSRYRTVERYPLGS